MATPFTFLDELLSPEQDEIQRHGGDTSLVPVPFLYLLTKPTPTERRSHVPKVIGFSENIVPEYNDRDFRYDFRISRETYENLVDRLRSTLKYPERPLGKPGVSPEKQIQIFVWYLSNQDSMREVARIFGVSKSTVYKCVRRVSKAICNMKELIRFPNKNEQNEISQAISEASNIEGCIGFVDGTHIRLSSIPGGDKDYVNRKGFPSILLQLIVDNNMVIRDTYVGWPGCTHDARVYRNSPIGQAISQPHSQLLIPDGFIIGDSAYPLHRRMITPFRDTGRLTRAQVHFNTIVSGQRQVVERTIGHLKGRFRRLRDLDCAYIQDACYLINAACSLHNLCLQSFDEIEDFVQTEADYNVAPNHYPPVYRDDAAGRDKRESIVRHLGRAAT